MVNSSFKGEGGKMSLSMQKTQNSTYMTRPQEPDPSNRALKKQMVYAGGMCGGKEGGGQEGKMHKTPLT